MVGKYQLGYVQSYKYLGVLFDKQPDFKQCEPILSESAGRSFSNIIAKHKGIDNLGYKTEQFDHS